VPQLAFADTQPTADAPEAAEGQGERRRRRRGGRGRDRERDAANLGGADAGSVEPLRAADEILAEDLVPSESGSESAIAANDATVSSDAGREGGEGRRRRGRDRNRRERGEDGRAAGDIAQAPDAAGIEQTRSEREPIEGAPAIAESTPVEAAAFEPAPVMAQSSPEVAPATALADVVEASTPRAVADEPPVAAVMSGAPAAPVEAFVLPMDQLRQIAEAAGLQWVNSDAEKIRVVQEAMAAEPPPVHVPRERKPVVRVDEGPLVLVETRKDLAQFKLPFETSVADSQPQA
jgi:ribonuclease E